NIGSKAVADEKKVAKKSSSMVDRIRGEPNTNRRPSRAAAMDTSLAGSRLWRLRSDPSRIIQSATSTNPNDTALQTYAHATPDAAMTMPPSAGPTTDAV